MVKHIFDLGDRQMVAKTGLAASMETLMMFKSISNGKLDINVIGYIKTTEKLLKMFEFLFYF